jgi:ribosomal protein L7/L12
MKLDRLKFAAVVAFIGKLRPEYDIDLYELDTILEFEIEQPKAGTVPCEAVDDLLKQMALREKIPAIKAYRTLTGAGLKEAKDAVERYWVSNKPDTRVDSMIKKIDEQINGTGLPDTDYVLSDTSSLHCVKDFIKSFVY